MPLHIRTVLSLKYKDGFVPKHYSSRTVSILILYPNGTLFERDRVVCFNRVSCCVKDTNMTHWPMKIPSASSNI